MDVKTLFVLVIITSLFQLLTTAEIGKCDQSVGNFLLELMMNMESEKTAVESKKVQDCYNSLTSDSAKKLKNSYDFRLEKYEFLSHDPEQCITFFLRDVDYMTEKCPAYDGFKSNNISEKRETLNSTKTCLLSVLTNYCSNETLSYMDTNYTKIVDYLTTTPANDSCESVQVDLHRGYTQYKRARVISDWQIFREYLKSWSTIPDIKRYNDTCNDLKKYNSDKCNIFSTDQAMKKCEVYTVIASEFYKCVERYGSLYPVRMGSCHPRNQACIKNRMIKECGKSSVVKFDKYYKWFNRYDLMRPDSIKLDDKDFTDYLQPKFKTEISSDSEIGKCAPIADELVSLLSRKYTFLPSKTGTIENKTCARIMDCYKSINSTDTKPIIDLFQVVCDKLEFKNERMFTYLHFFYKELRYENKTFENSGFFSKNTTIKRKAFLEGKDYLLGMADDKYGIGSKYLRKNYTHFVDLITIRPKSDTNCTSVYSTTENIQCTPIIDSLAISVNLTTNWDSTLAVLIWEECRLAEKCLIGATCPTKETTMIRYFCAEASQGNIYFLSCLEKLRQERPNFSDEHCAKSIAKKTKTGGAYMRLFEKEKECLKTVMRGKCRPEAVMRFDDNYKNVDENMKRDA